MPSLFKDIEPSITQKIEVYKKPPLAFCGNKKNAYNLLQSVIKELKHKADFKESELIVVDVFGGSGLLSHIFKQALPKARVIWNDYDDFQKRLDNIKSTNEILAALNPPPPAYKKLKMSTEEKERILKLVREKEGRGDFIDYITLSSFVLFGGNYAKDYKELEKQTFYYHYAQKPAPKSAAGYLKGVKRVQKDYKELIAEFRDDKNALLLLDPPYLQTMVDSYSMDSWRLKDFLDLIQIVRKPYIFFSSEKSDILEFLDFLDGFSDNFKGRKIKTYNLNAACRTKNKREFKQEQLKAEKQSHKNNGHCARNFSAKHTK